MVAKSFHRVAFLGACFFSGCVTPDQPAVQTRDSSRAVTLGIDAKDYNAVAERLIQSIQQSGLNPGMAKKVIALGPVETRNCAYQVDVRRLQEKMQTLLLQSQQWSMTYALDAMKESDVAQARFKQMQLQFEQDQTLDKEDLMTFGQLAKVDYLLFGRISSITAASGGTREVTYTFNWKLGDCRSGLVDWSDEYEHAKQGGKPGRPLWIDRPKDDDSVYTYQLGAATGKRSEQEALSAARDSALRALASAIDTRLDPTDGLRSAEPMDGCRHVEKVAGRYNAWVQYSFPIRERERILQQFESVGSARADWIAVQEAYSRGEWRKARDRAMALLNSGVDPKLAGYTRADLHMLMAEAAREEKNILEARRWYDVVLESREAPPALRTKAKSRIAALPRSPRFWKMKERFDGRKVALLCGVREGGRIGVSNGLNATLAKDCREAELPVALVARPFDQDTAAMLFDAQDISELLGRSAGAGAGVGIAVLLDIDPSLRGKTRMVYGAEMPAIDTRVKVLVVDVAAGKLLYQQTFKETAGAGSDDRVAARAASILVQKYLVPKCPAVGQ